MPANEVHLTARRPCAHDGVSGRRLLLQAGLVTAAALVLPPAGAHEVVTSTLRVIHPFSRATAPGATSAVLCMTFDDVITDDRLIGVSSPVASAAEMGGTRAGQPAGRVDLPIPQGRQTGLDEAESHVRLLGLRLPLEVGTSHPVTLVFEKGGSYITTFTVDFARFD